MHQSYCYSQENLETMGFSQHFQQDKCSGIENATEGPVKVQKKLQEAWLNPIVSKFSCDRIVFARSGLSNSSAIL